MALSYILQIVKWMFYMGLLEYYIGYYKYKMIKNAYRVFFYYVLGDDKYIFGRKKINLL